MACSKYTITNTGSTIVNFNYRRCDDSLWEYQVELLPNQTKNIWLIDDTYSTAFINEVEITSVESWPPPPLPPSVNVYSQDISGDFPISFVTCQFFCDMELFNGVDTNIGANSVQEVVEVLNSDPETSQYGYYFNGGRGKVGLSILESLLYTVCPSGDMTLFIRED